MHSHTDCQATPAKAQTKAWQRVCLPHRTTNRQSGHKTEEQQLTRTVQKNKHFHTYFP